MQIDPWQAAGVLIWLVGLTFVAGRLYERLENVIKRLNQGDNDFVEVRKELKVLTGILQEMRGQRANELRRTNALVAQTRALWAVVAKINPTIAGAAAAEMRAGA